MKKENIRVPVISLSGEPLMPTTASRARRWIKRGKAKSFWNVLGIWCVQLLVEPSGTQTQDIIAGSDPGKRYPGIAVQSAKYTLFMSHLVLMGFIPKQGTAIAGIKEKMFYRSMLRRGRRGRRINRSKVFKLRNHRQKRFSNRKKTKLAPSIRSNRQLEIRVISKLAKIYPIKAIRVEKVRADIDRTSGRKGAKSGICFSPVMVGQAWMIDQLSQMAPVITIDGWQKDGNGTSQVREHLKLIKNQEYSTKSKGEIKKVIGYCSGYTGKNLSLSDANWSRLGRFANSKCRILARNTGLVISGGFTPTQLPSYPPTTNPSGYGRSSPEA